MTRQAKPQLGWLLPNHAIRRAAYAEVMELLEVERITGVQVRCAANLPATVPRWNWRNGETSCAHNW